MAKVLFHHLAKTAGTTLIESLQRVFEGSVCGARYDHELTDEIMIDDNTKFYHGHYSFNKVSRFRNINPDAFIFTFVRHPFNRVLSQYYNWTDQARVLSELDAVRERSGENALFDERREKFENIIFNMTLDDFLASEDEDIREVTFNHQAAYVTDETEFRPALRLVSAVSNIVHFYDYVGVMELYEPCVRILELKLCIAEGAAGGFPAKNINVGGKADGYYATTEAQLSTLAALNGHDMALHAAAYTRLVKDHADFLPGTLEKFPTLLAMPIIREGEF